MRPVATPVDAAPTEVRSTGSALRVRWLGRVPYREAWALQHGLHAHGVGDHLLLVEHPPTYTLGRHADRSNLLRSPADLGAELVDVDRGGDVTFHGPGQLVAYPVLTLPPKGAVPGGLPDTPGYVHLLEAVLIDTLADLGVPAGRRPGCPGVWVEPDAPTARKIAAIGVRIDRGRSLHGIALNVTTDLSWFDRIVPCGIRDRGVTSMAAEGAEVDMAVVADRFVERFARRWAPGHVERADVVRRDGDADLAPFSRGRGPGVPTGGGNRPRAVGESTTSTADAGVSVRLRGRLAQAGVSGGLSVTDRKPDWLRARVEHGPEVLAVKRTVRDLDLVTVCEEAGCPNLSECWSDGTATFMVCGERCTRACGFCLVDTRKPAALDPDEPERVAEAVARMGLDLAVITMVARDDLVDGGAAHVAAVVRAVRERRPDTEIEVLISDLQGDPHALDTVLAAGPDVVNHNVETVPRLQRAVRPSASYARSLAVLSRARAAGAVTKSGLVLGMGETEGEVAATLADLASVGVSIVTAGQYLRPTSHHLPVARWWAPEEFEWVARTGHDLGIAHVEASPFTRSSHHARASLDAARASRGAT